MDELLFRLPPPSNNESSDGHKKAAPRVLTPNRDQIELRSVDLEGLLPADHRARIVWDFVERMDLGPLYAEIRAVEGHSGRPAIDPRIMMALWLFATIEGIGSARALNRMTQEHDAYRWICGGVSVNYHTLADFRVDHGEFLDGQLTASTAALMSLDLVELNRVAQDGVRVRASAGAASFRRKSTLEECLEEAEAQVEALRKELEDDPSATSRRQKAARERAAQERKRRVEEALAKLPEVEAKKKAAEKQKARVSTTDPDARVMKMADGGFRPAFNIQFSTDVESQVITGVDVSNSGSDQGQLAPMVEQNCDRYGRCPVESLVDGGYARLDDIDAATAMGTTVLMPVPQPRDETRDPHVRRPGDSDPVAQWRERMGTEEAKQAYKDRASTAECVNAIARNRGLRQFLVRGRQKVKAVVLWYALAHNMMRIARFLSADLAPA